MSRKLTEAQKKRIAGKQLYKCANKPNTMNYRLEDYDCPYWLLEGERKGSFDESGYEIDHIMEFSISNDDSEKNLQALCLPCHRVKTTRFIMNKHKNHPIIVNEIDNEKDIKEFIKKYFDKTNNDENRISKLDFMKQYNVYRDGNNGKWIDILPLIKKLGLKYSRQKRVNGQQGCLIGLRKKINNQDLIEI